MTTREVEPELQTDHQTDAREFSSPNGEYSQMLAFGKLFHLPLFEDEPETEPTDDIPHAS